MPYKRYLRIALKEWKQRIEKYLLSDLGKFPLDDIIAPQAIKTIANQGKLDTVGRLCRNLNEIMNFAVNTGAIGLLVLVKRLK